MYQETMSSTELSTNGSFKQNYKDDIDFDEAFKNLLRPIESITTSCEFKPLRYNLLKELDSYLNHLRILECSPELFVEASFMIKNVILIYQRRVDWLFDAMMKLIGEFRSYRINQNYNDSENGEKCNQKKKKENKVTFYASFEPIEVKVSEKLKKFDAKTINLSKKEPVPKIALNANIEIDNKYTEILPYILTGKGVIRNKYDYMLSFPINRDFTVNEEINCFSNENNTSTNFLNDRKSSDPLPNNLNDVDKVNILEIHTSIEEPVIFDQIVNDVVPHVVENPIIDNMKDVSQTSSESDCDPWEDLIVKDKHDDTFINKPIKNRKCNKSPEYQGNSFWLPSYIYDDFNNNLIKTESSIHVDPVFKLKYQEVIKAQRSEIAEFRRKKNIEEGLDGQGFERLDGPVYDNNFVNNDDENFDDYQEENAQNFQSYQENAMAMEEHHEQHRLEIMNEQFEMQKRIQDWHDTIQPLLEKEEENIDFDVHVYGTYLLNCFSAIGEKKTFKELAGGLSQEETARYFSATLMLVSTNNFKITKTSDGSQNEIIIELLKKERHHEELQVSFGNQVNQTPDQ